MIKYLEMKVPPPIIALIIAGVMWLLTRVNQLDTVLFVSSYLQKSLIIILIFLGFVIELSAVIKFRQHKTTINPMNPKSTSSLVMTGIYRYSRNPMYLGMQLQLLAFSIYLNGVIPLLLCFFYAIYITYLQIKPEEKMLKTLFNGQYQDYQSSVSRWIGFPSRLR